MASISTGNKRRDSHLKAGDFFEVETHPGITFVSERVTKVSDTEKSEAGQPETECTGIEPRSPASHADTAFRPPVSYTAPTIAPYTRCPIRLPMIMATLPPENTPPAIMGVTTTCASRNTRNP